MTKFFSNDENPAGWKLEDVLSEVQKEVIRRSMKILSDERPEARNVLHNNIEILGWLTRCVKVAEDSSRVLLSLGPEHGADQPPRIGDG